MTITDFAPVAARASAGVTRVLNLANCDWIEFSCGPRAAVIAAYAQHTMKDFNTWDYEAKYGALVEYGSLTVLCGDFSAFKTVV